MGYARMVCRTILRRTNQSEGELNPTVLVIRQMKAGEMRDQNVP
jgi:hypothetical protein